MMWALAARPGDITSLRRQDVALEPTRGGDGTYGLVTVQKYGKGTKFRGTYMPLSTLPEENAQELQRLLNQRRPKQLLFKDAEALKDMVRVALKVENRQAALPSVRKGAIRHLAKMGVPEETIMQLTGHTRRETLMVYLGLGRQLTREAVAAQDSAGRVHYPAPSGQERGPQRPRSSG